MPLKLLNAMAVAYFGLASGRCRNGDRHDKYVGTVVRYSSVSFARPYAWCRSFSQGFWLSVAMFLWGHTGRTCSPVPNSRRRCCFPVGGTVVDGRAEVGHPTKLNRFGSVMSRDESIISGSLDRHRWRVANVDVGCL